MSDLKGVTLRVTISRREWVRGRCGLLYERATGRMCPQGFVGEACGVSREVMAGHASFCGIARSGAYLPPRIYDLFILKSDAADGGRADGAGEFSGGLDEEFLTTELAEETMSINDSVRLDISDGERERRLIGLYAPHDVEIEFVD
jgi:hypothetical protein